MAEDVLIGVRLLNAGIDPTNEKINSFPLVELNLEIDRISLTDSGIASVLKMFRKLNSKSGWC